MREIKFRAWHQTDKVMYELGRLEMPWEFSDIKIMQFTGLRDSKGTEIYEGDIVSITGINCSKCPNHKPEDGCVNSDEPCPNIEIARDVVTMGRFPLYWLEHECFGYEGEELKSPSDAEVIGNVYEHPDLLKGE